MLREGIAGGELDPADPRLLSWIYVAMVEVMLTPYAATLYSDEEAMVGAVLDLFFSGARQTAKSAVSLPG